MEKISLDVVQKKIFLAPFPFSDLSLEKVRPVLVISNDIYNDSSDDVIVCAISSKLDKFNSVSLSSEDLDEGILFKKSIIKFDSLFKLEKSLLLKSIGIISDDKFDFVKGKILELF